MNKGQTKNREKKVTMSKGANEIKYDANKVEKIKKLLLVEETKAKTINKLVDKIGDLVSEEALMRTHLTK